MDVLWRDPVDKRAIHGLDDLDTSFVPDTPENRQRLLAIVSGMTELSNRLSALLGKDEISTTLLTLHETIVPALPMPKKKGKKRRG